MTEQEIFNTVCDHLMKQGEHSMNYNGCAYRGLKGQKCAVGCLITDDEYSVGMEGSDVERLFDRGDLPSRLKPHAELLVRLQIIHDGGAVPNWPTHLRMLAAKRNLTVPASVPA